MFLGSVDVGGVDGGDLGRILIGDEIECDLVGGDFRNLHPVQLNENLALVIVTSLYNA